MIPALLSALLVIGCDDRPNLEAIALKAENTRLLNELQGRDSLIGDMTLSFGEIENNIRLMDERERMISGDTALEEMSLNRKDGIVRDLQLMNGLMKESRVRIEELTMRLDRSGIDAKGLRAKLKELDVQLAQRDSAITTMKGDLLARDFRIEHINKNLDSITMVVAKREAIIEQQTTELNKAYYVTGTERELETKGILTKEGGFIGIGARTALDSDFPSTPFIRTDMRDLHRISVNARKAELVTEHPASSYKMVEQDDRIAYLEIKDAAAFWKLSKYAVLELK